MSSLNQTTGMITNVNGAIYTVTNNVTVQTTSSNYIAGDIQLTSSAWTNITFDALADVLNVFIKNDASVNTGSVISLATGSNGSGIFSILIPNMSTNLGWSGSYNNNSGIYAKVVGGWPTGTPTPNAGQYTMASATILGILMYCTSTDIINRIDAVNLAAAISDYDVNAPISSVNSSAQLNNIIQMADGAVDALLASIYKTPFSSPVPAKAKEASIVFSCEAIYARRLTFDQENPFRKLADFWRDDLKRIGAGELSLDAKILTRILSYYIFQDEKQSRFNYLLIKYDRTEPDLNVSIANQMTMMRDYLNGWAVNNNGVAIVEEETDKKLLFGYLNCIGPKMMISFKGEDAVGSEEVKELIGRARRYFEIKVERRKLMSAPKTSTFNESQGPIQPFSDLLETIRNILRCIIWPVPMITNPTEYQGMSRIDKDEETDSFIITISTVCDIGRIILNDDGVQQPEEYIQLQNPTIPTLNQNS